MSQAPNVENTAVAGLLRLLEESSARQCAELTAKAAEKMAAIKRQAYQQARGRIRHAVAEERTRIRQEIGRVDAEIETELRRRTLRHAARLVEAGRAGLEQTLRERWQDAAARQAWSSTLLDQCRQVLLGHEWLMYCPSDWPDDERRQAIEQAREQAGALLTIENDGQLAEGLRVRCGGVTVDMSVAGLLSDQAAIDSALLYINSCVRQGDPQ